MNAHNKLLEPTPVSIVALRGCLQGGAAQQRRYMHVDSNYKGHRGSI